MRIHIVNIDRLKNDVKDLLAVAPFYSQERKWFARAYMREVLRSRHYREADGPEVADGTNVKSVIYQPSETLTETSRYILDWLAELSQRDARLHSKLPRITFKQASHHSKKWHEALAKAAGQLDRHIAPDEKNAPKVLDLGGGWEVFWLKTDTARDIEGEVMGHCIGSGGYDDLGDGEAVLSIRKNNVAHITMHLDGFSLVDAVTKGNDSVPERYQHLVSRTRTAIGLRLEVKNSPEDDSDILDGWYRLRNGVRIHLQNGMLHRDDGPAEIYPEASGGRKSWYQNNVLHRDDGPAVDAETFQQWYQHGRLHREDGPAEIERNGKRQRWYRNGVLHREDGPAVIHRGLPEIWGPDGKECETKNSAEEWWLNGKRHRDDGPAVDSATFQQWYQHGKLHREDGPAEIERNGKRQRWYRNGVLHREDGPAVIHADGREEWYRDGELHREDGPAVIDPDGREQWYWDGRPGSPCPPGA